MPKPGVLGQRAEGPTLVVDGDKIRLYVDYYSDGRFGVFETSEWMNWTDSSARVSIVNGLRHGTVLTAPTWLAAGVADSPLGPIR